MSAIFKEMIIFPSLQDRGQLLRIGRNCSGASYWSASVQPRPEASLTMTFGSVWWLSYLISAWLLASGCAFWKPTSELCGVSTAASWRLNNCNRFAFFAGGSSKRLCISSSPRIRRNQPPSKMQPRKSLWPSKWERLLRRSGHRWRRRWRFRRRRCPAWAAAAPTRLRNRARPSIRPPRHNATPSMTWWAPLVSKISVGWSSSRSTVPRTGKRTFKVSFSFLSLFAALLRWRHSNHLNWKCEVLC